jgi:excisionase family DNA binding protein
MFTATHPTQQPATSAPDSDRWLTLDECADRANCHVATLRRLIKAGILRHARLGTKHIRVRASWLDAALEACATPVERR